MRLSLVLALLIAARCAPPAGPGTTTTISIPPQAADPRAPRPDGSGGWFALAEVESTNVECSGAGGESAGLAIIAPSPMGPHRATIGGHARYVYLGVGQLAVVHVRPIPHPRRSRGAPGWCVPAGRIDDAQVIASMALGGADGAATLADLAAHGWPANVSAVEGGWPGGPRPPDLD